MSAQVAAVEWELSAAGRNWGNCEFGKLSCRKQSGQHVCVGGVCLGVGGRSMRNMRKMLIFDLQLSRARVIRHTRFWMILEIIRQMFVTL